jgi:uncharacterized protein YjbI with pentapeptide repeats
MADEHLQGAAVSSLSGARFERCDLSGATISLLEEIELVDCIFDEANLSMANLRRSTIMRCRLRGAWLALSDFDDARIEEGDWLGSYLERSHWPGARVTGVSFRSCTLIDGRFDGATFTDCDFAYANLSRKDLAVDFARCTNTRFVRCNFQGANLDGLRFNNTVFDHCRFNDTTGKPDLEGPCTLIEPDFSSRGDGFDSITGKSAIRPAEEVLRVWREWDAPRISFWSRNPAGAVYEPEKHYPERRGSKDDDKSR